MSKLEKYQIPLFDVNNFDNRKFRLLMLLKEKECIQFVYGIAASYQTNSDNDQIEKKKNLEDFQKEYRKYKSFITQFITRRPFGMHQRRKFC